MGRACSLLRKRRVTAKRSARAFPSTSPDQTLRSARMRSLRQRTVSGLGWSGATQILGLALQFATSVLLARLLGPVEFGLVGAIVVFTGFATALVDLGLGASLIQKQAGTERHLYSAFWLNVAAGAVLAVLVVASGPILASFFGDPRIAPLAMCMSATLVLGALNVVPNALLEKSLAFRSRFWIEAIAIGSSGSLAVALASAGAGAWSLVAQAVGLAAAKAIATWRLSRWRPRWVFDRAAILELLSFGRPLMAFNAIIYWSSNFDKVVVGRLIGTGDLGTYNLADRLMRIPLTGITGVTQAVMFPALSTLRDDTERVRRIYLRANRMIALVSFPAMLGLSVLADPVILFVFGSAWEPAAGILGVLCFAGLAQSVYNTASWIFLSQARPDILFRLGVYTTAIRIAGALVGMRWGVLGIATAYVLGGYACILYPTWRAAGGLIGVGVAALIRNVMPPLLCSVVMATAIWAGDRYLLGGLRHGVRLAIFVPSGIVFYVFLARSLRLQAWNDLRTAVFETRAGGIGLVRRILGDEPVSGTNR